MRHGGHAALRLRPRASTAKLPLCQVRSGVMASKAMPMGAPATKAQSSPLRSFKLSRPGMAA
jgi:hypothetical protein